jgi:ferredoxin-NADP reductase
MERTALPRRLAWQLGRIVDLDDEPRTRSLLLDVPNWPGHTAGQHVDVRLRAEDGYQAQRSYSIASPPEERHVTLTIERLDNGEVSPYLTDVLQCGDQLELRGPLLIGGGSGIVPLMAMIHHRTARQSMGAYPEDGMKMDLVLCGSNGARRT